MSKSKILAIMGSPSSGTTVTSVKIARELSKQKKNVIIVSLDMTCPTIPYVLPSGTEHNVSLGSLLTDMSITQKDILSAAVPVPNNQYVSIISYKLGESMSSYPEIVRAKAVEFFTLVSNLADYIIVDCSTVIEADIATVVALTRSDYTLKLATSNLKGVTSFFTTDRLLADSTFKKEKNIVAISNHKEWQEWECVSQQLGGAKYVLPYCAEIEQQADELRLFEKLKDKASNPYQKELSKLVEGIFMLESVSDTETGQSSKTTKERKGFKNPFSKSKGEF